MWFMPCISRPHLDVGSGAPGYFGTGPTGWVSGTWRNPAGMATVSLARFCAVGGSQLISAACQGPGFPGAGRITTRIGRYVSGLTQMVSEILLPGRLVSLIASIPSTRCRPPRQVSAGDRGLDQLALALLIQADRYDRHLRRMRAEYAARRGVLVQALAQHAPGVRLTGLAAGFHAVAHLPVEIAEHDVIQAARSRSVGLYGMSTHRADHAPSPPQLALGFGNTSQRAIKTGVISDLLQTRQ